MKVCPTCGRENPDDARFCGGCATRLAETDAREERKVVTVLFCDLVGSTAQAERMDPEDVRALLSHYYERVRSELERFGGTVEKFIGDAVVALFGAPVAHEDDPERAVRAALAIREWAQEEGELRVRIGITTGEALVLLAPKGQGMAAGDVVNTAARVQTHAEVNGILVDEATYRATRDAISFADRDHIVAKGKRDPVPIWAAIEARSRLGVDVVRGAPRELVGRTRELGILRESLARVREERRPQLVSIVGVPGIGKSRLVYELLRVVEEDDEIIFWRQGRSLPYGEGVSYWALAEIVKAQAGILETDSAPEAEAKLSQAVAALVDEEERGWVEHHLRPLIGLGAELELGGDRKAEAFAAWRRLFETMAARSPFVLVFEDLQWADDGMLDFVDHLVDWVSGVPLLVVVAARPELLARRAGWGGGKANATTLSLAPLSEDETARLIGLLLGRSVLPADTQVELLTRAGGNPLYAEQFTRMLEEQGAEGSLSVPETVQGIIAARLDALPADQKQLLQDAAVVGKVFWLGSLTLGDRERWTVEEGLHELERREFIRRQQRSSVAGENEYAFQHLLVRDVAYGQIPRGARADKHRLAAEWIESLSPDRSEDRSELLAHHYSSALEYANAAGQETASLSERARLVLRDAADRSASLFAFGDAERHYAAALKLWPAEDPARPRIQLERARAHFLAGGVGIDLLEDARDRLLGAGELVLAAVAEITIADAQWHLGELDSSAEHQRRAAELVEEAPPSSSKAFVLSNVSRFRMLAGANEEAIRVGRAALAMADDLRLDGLRAHALNNIGSARVHLGDRAGMADIERSIEISTIADPFESMRGYGNLGSMMAEHGDLDRHAGLTAKALELARHFGISEGIRWFEWEEIVGLFWRGRWKEVLERSSELIAETESGTPFYLEGMWRAFRGRIRLAQGDLEPALDDALRGLDLGRRANDPQLSAPIIVFAARALVDAGRREEADHVLDELDLPGRPEILLVSGMSVDVPSVFLELDRGEELLAAMERLASTTLWLDAARAYAGRDFVGAADAYTRIGSLPDEAYARLRAAEQLVMAGSRAEADVELQKALAFWRSVGAKRYVRDGEALLAVSA